MKPIDRKEVLGLADYETVRERFRARVIAEKKLRRVILGPRASALFENRDTVLLQIQEMLRTERITRPAAIDHEIDTYNELLPAQDELSVSLMIEIADKDERDAFLRAAKGLEHHVWLVSGPLRVAARASLAALAADEGIGLTDRTTAVHYLKFSLPSDLANALRDRQRRPAPSLAFEIDHPAYAVHADLPAQTVAALGEDLQA